MTKFLVAIIFILSTQFSWSQDRLTSKNYQVVAKDSIMLFFDNRYHFVGKECVKNVRLVGLNSAGQFDGYFEDLSIKDRLLGKGNYRASLKEGPFEIYHSNGNLKVKGYYHEDKPADTWEYFYVNGQKERTIKFAGNEILMLQFVDAAGNVMVKDGNGVFKGPVNPMVGASETYVIAEGTVVDGRPHGKWTSSFMGGRYCVEEFDNGKYLGGTSPTSGLPKDQHQKHLDKFKLKDYFEQIDHFFVEKCEDSVMYVRHPRIEKKKLIENVSISEMFESSIKNGIDRVVADDVRTKSHTEDYSVGEHFLTIRITVNGKNGKGKDFSLLSGWGQQFLREIRSSINSHVTFPTDRGEYYFHMRVSISGSAFVSFKYAISQDLTNRL